MRRNQPPEPIPWLRSFPIMRAMQGINGFLYDEEADLLLAATARVLAMRGLPRTVVEIGSFCGKSTVVFGMVAKVLHPDARVYAIDPHEGELSVGDETVRGEPTFATFQRNMATHGLEQVVVPIRERSTAVRWDKPIGLLFVDGLHDYHNVSQDFAHYSPWVVPGGLVAFHDYGKHDFPGVTVFVDEVVAGGGYLLVQRAGALAVLEKLDTRRRVLGVPLSAPRLLSGLWDGPSRRLTTWQSTAARKRDARVVCIEDGIVACPEGENE